MKRNEKTRGKKRQKEKDTKFACRTAVDSASTRPAFININKARRQMKMNEIENRPADSCQTEAEK